MMAEDLYAVSEQRARNNFVFQRLQTAPLESETHFLFFFNGQYRMAGNPFHIYPVAGRAVDIYMVQKNVR